MPQERGDAVKIGIVGLGQVGETLAYGFNRIGHQVVGHDIKIERSRLENVLSSELCFICVPTPSMPDGSCNTMKVESSVLELNKLNYEGLIVIKSTVTPGTTDMLANYYPKLRLAFCPEFLREKSRFSDFVENHDVCIIGSCDGDVDLIKEAHGTLPKQFVWVSAIEAEFAKYFSNCFNAMRITFANEFASVCEQAGVDYSNIKNAITKRTSIGNYYLDSNENFRAFGGNCLPKDADAFSHYAAKLGVDVDLINTMIGVNEKLKGKRDAEAA